ncbi:MAG: ComF family protein [Dehalococcoidales bacterium]|nr:ComF family protein [Dehalococcoidales bacterium]
MLPPLTKLKKVALDLLFPQWCIGCGREGDYICESCRQTLSVITPPICPRCGRPQSQGILCHECVDWVAEIDGIRSPFFFDGVIRRAVHELKYRNLRALASSLAEFLRDYLVENPVTGDVLVPVPLHRRRYRERGYNQSALLARELGRLSGLPVVENCLIRHGYALPQARSASVGERRDNVADTFACRDGQLRGREVILVDDVSTSGATLDACAGMLKSAGAVAVWGLVIALEL